MPAKTKPLFESEICSRCGGCGEYSYNPRHGRVCYGCGGSGWKLTKRGAAAQKFYNDLRSKDLKQLQVGDVFKGEGCTLSGDIYRRNMVVVAVDEKEVTYRDGKDIGYIIIPAFESKVIVLFKTEEERCAARAKALAYQETLTKTGTVRKQKGK